MKFGFNETHEEFMNRYSLASGLNCPGSVPLRWGVDCLALPCSCEDGGGPWHWAHVANDEQHIAEHFRQEVLYSELRGDK